jgi:hypothetical protein
MALATRQRTLSSFRMVVYGDCCANLPSLLEVLHLPRPVSWRNLGASPLPGPVPIDAAFRVNPEAVAADWPFEQQRLCERFVGNPTLQQGW